MTNNNRINPNFSSNSSEIWGDDSIRINSDYCNFKELQTSGLFRLVIATRFGRKVMLKSLKDEVKDVLRYKELLHKEFDILMSLNSTYNVNVITWEEDIIECGACIVMEYVDGLTLDKYLAQSPSKKDKLYVLSEILNAVDYIHGRQIVHRDLKPSNIIVQSDGQHIKLIDFGLADSEAYEILKQPCGTEGYVSPEQREGINDIRNDIYSLGCIIKEMKLGWLYKGIVNQCLSSIEQRPSSVQELLYKIEGVDKKKTFGLRILVFSLLIIIGGTYWYQIFNGDSTTEQTRIEQNMRVDTIERVLDVLANPQPTKPIYKDYHVFLKEIKNVIDKDVVPINTMMDTASHIDYIHPTLSKFLEGESDKLNRFAESHKEDIIPSDYMIFYNEMMTYYKVNTDRWMSQMDKLGRRDTH